MALHTQSDFPPLQPREAYGKLPAALVVNVTNEPEVVWFRQVDPLFLPAPANPRWDQMRFGPTRKERGFHMDRYVAWGRNPGPGGHWRLFWKRGVTGNWVTTHILDPVSRPVNLFDNRGCKQSLFPADQLWTPETLDPPMGLPPCEWKRFSLNAPSANVRAIFSNEYRQDPKDQEVFNLDRCFLKYNAEYDGSTLLQYWHGCKLDGSTMSGDESRKLGISLKWVLETFPGDVQQKSGKSSDKVHQMNFVELSRIAAYGDSAYGKNKRCPRDSNVDCSIVDAVYEETHSAMATIFLSWAWIYSLFVALGALTNFRRSQSADFDASKCYLWWCFFQNNQFRILGDGTPQSFDSLREVFGSQLRNVGRMVCMLDRVAASAYSSRLWCLYEVFVADEHHIPMEVIIPEAAKRELETLFQGGFVAVKNALLIDSQRARASMSEDQRNIKALIETKGYDVVNDRVHKALRRSVVIEVDRALD